MALSLPSCATLHNPPSPLYRFVYMKLFKDVLQCDVDMLLPGSVIKFTWFDYVSGGGPSVALRGRCILCLRTYGNCCHPLD